MSIFIAIMIILGNVKPPDNVVRIYVQDKYGRMSYGSGGLLSERIVITNHHVIDQGKSIIVLFPDWICHTASVVKADVKVDLAALRLDEPTKTTPLKLGKIPKVDDVVTFWGYGKGIPVSQTGKITELFEDKIIIDAPARSGDSGGPFFNEKGECVGILSSTNGKMTRGPHIGTILTFLVWENKDNKIRLY